MTIAFRLVSWLDRDSASRLAGLLAAILLANEALDNAGDVFSVAVVQHDNLGRIVGSCRAVELFDDLDQLGNGPVCPRNTKELLRSLAMI